MMSKMYTAEFKSYKCMQAKINKRLYENIIKKI
jgi:hypothetical protein